MARIPIHPGEVLAEDLEVLDMSVAELARQLKVPTNRVTEILNGQCAPSPVTRLCAWRTFSAQARNSG